MSGGLTRETNCSDFFHHWRMVSQKTLSLAPSQGTKHGGSCDSVFWLKYKSAPQRTVRPKTEEKKRIKCVPGTERTMTVVGLNGKPSVKATSKTRWGSMPQAFLATDSFPGKGSEFPCSQHTQKANQQKGLDQYTHSSYFGPSITSRLQNSGTPDFACLSTCRKFRCPLKKWRATASASFWFPFKPREPSKPDESRGEAQHGEGGRLARVRWAGGAGGPCFVGGE